VKATWLNASPERTSSGTSRAGDIDQQVRPGAGANTTGNIALGGQGPAHAIGSEAQLHQATGEATFRGHARLWQDANSVAGPEIVLNREKQTLVARSNDPAESVRVVLVSAENSGLATPGASGVDQTTANDQGKKSGGGSVIRVRGGDLRYSDAEHKAVMHAGAPGPVVAETGTATSVSNEVEMTLLPPGNHAGKNGGQGQVDRMTASGHVTVSSEGRKGTGERLVYSSETGEYVLTGTAAAPPRMTDPVRGTVSGGALIFNSRDDSVSSEGDGRKTTTETTTPK
jgi:lipopolysaccharide export system protein LptA